MKNFKLVAAIAAAAILVVGASMTSFAAYGWQEENGVWKYYDKNGDAVSGEWKKSGENWFYLDDNGEMAVDQLVEWNDNYYYVDANGAMATNCWKFIADEEGNENWYYFQNSGKAYKRGDALAWKTINGKKYAFTDEAKMVYGWIDKDGQMIDDEDNTAFADGLYYCGGIEDGSRRASVWEYLPVGDEMDDDFAWFYFGSNGQKYDHKKGATKINGKYYRFNEAGKMATGWNTIASPASEATVSDYNIFNGTEDGSEIRGQWIWKVPGENVKKDNTDWDTDTAHWYYANKNGSLKTNEFAKINGKYYAFNENSEMVAGLYKITWNTDGSIKAVKVDDAEMKKLKDVSEVAKANADTRDGYYFFGDEETDGSMKTGTLTVTVADDDYTMMFSSTGYKGKAFNGKKNKLFYANGVKIAASGDDKYMAYKVDKNGYVTESVAAEDLIANVDLKDSKGNVIGKGSKTTLADTKSKYILLTTSGSTVTSGTKKDGNDYKFVVKNSKIEGLYLEW